MINNYHKFYTECEDKDCKGNCPKCSLTICKECGLYEGSLTTECCGEEVSGILAVEISEGKLDYRNNKWFPGLPNRFMFLDLENNLEQERLYFKSLLSEPIIEIERYINAKTMVNILIELARNNK